MDLVSRFLAARRDKLLMRLGCWLVCFSLILGLMLPQQRAEAAAATVGLTGAVAVVCAYFCACGLKFVVSGVQEAGLTDFVSRLFGEYAVATNISLVPGPDDDPNLPPLLLWLGPNFVTRSPIDQLLLTRAVVMKLVDFAQWVVQRYGTQTGVNVVYSDQYITFYDGSTYALSYFHDIDEADTGGSVFKSYQYSLGTPIQFGTESAPTEIQLTSTHKIFFCDGSKYHRFKHDGGLWNDSFSLAVNPVTFLVGVNGRLYLAGVYPQGYLWVNQGGLGIASAEEVSSLIGGGSLSIDRAPSMSYIPDDIAADQGIALDVGAAATMDLDLVLGGVLDDVLAGTLDSTMTAAGEAVVTPPAGEITDVDNLGLPALGAALTSRFPFSIPWDFFRAVQLLAAPAKAPYFEVDFMAPLADQVGGWQGDTKMVLDFGQYAIVGQISRWTSTIGFCLMLASATKRLIWTA